MPHIQFELDAMKSVAPAARAAGVAVEAMGWGLPQLWAWCWSEKRDTATAVHLAGFFGGDGQRIGEALEAFDFAEKVAPNEWRIRGAKKYLRISEARADAGRSTQAKRREQAVSAQQLLNKPPALPPTTEHRSPSSSSDEELPPSGEQAGGGGDQVSPDVKLEAFRAKADSGVMSTRDAWEFFQEIRSVNDVPREKKQPRGFDAWWFRASTHRGRLFIAFRRYLEDEDFKPKRWPLAVFMSPNVWEPRL